MIYDIRLKNWGTFKRGDAKKVGEKGYMISG